MRHLDSLKSEIRSNKAIVSICSLVLGKVTFEGVLIFTGGEELIVLLLCLLPIVNLCVDS